VTQMMIVPLLDVTIDRGRSVIAVAVPKHEVDVLRAVHGVKEVQVTGESRDTLELNSNADVEFDRLRRKYYRANASDPVSVAYRVGPSQLEPYGFVMGRAMEEGAAQSIVIDHRYDNLPEPTAEPDAITGKAAK
jgi:hypothetical protein